MLRFGALVGGRGLPLLMLRAGQVQAKPRRETRGPCLLGTDPWPAAPAESWDLLGQEHSAALRLGRGFQVGAGWHLASLASGCKSKGSSPYVVWGNSSSSLRAQPLFSSLLPEPCSSQILVLYSTNYSMKSLN